ncbi:glycerophosphodiester phosphodiesterase family protein [Ectobacillus funiculus]
MPVVVHGLGFIEGYYVTNSLDALLVNYKRGFRVFEIDLNMTSDGHLVARHDWTPGHYQYLGQAYQPVAGPIPFETFMSLKIHSKYQPASWEDILQVMREHPDLYVITDTKERDKNQVHQTFSYLVKAAKKVDPKYWIVLFRKFMIQLCLAISSRTMISNISFTPCIIISISNLQNSWRIGVHVTILRLLLRFLFVSRMICARLYKKEGFSSMPTRLMIRRKLLRIGRRGLGFIQIICFMMG